MAPNRLHLVPVRASQARTFVEDWHRHHPPPVGLLFATGCATDDGVLRGVAIVGRPVAAALDDGLTVEVTRVAVDGWPNACSMLYGAAARAAMAMGYQRVVTYTQEGESGASLRAAGYRIIAQLPARKGWDCAARNRPAVYRSTPRTLWEAS